MQDASKVGAFLLIVYLKLFGIHVFVYNFLHLKNMINRDRKENYNYICKKKL